jgi:hypothetical protein
MGRQFLEIGEMNTDEYGFNEEGSWYINNLVDLGGSYHAVGQITKTNISVSDSATTQGNYVWRKGYNTSVTYHTTNSSIYEVGVGSRCSGKSTPTYGWRFAAFGPALFATNGSGATANDMIQVSTGGNFSNITIPTVTGNTFADPRPKFLITFKNQLVGANITTTANYGPLSAGTYPHLVWWSGRGNGEMWGALAQAPNGLGSNYLPIFDGSYEITGLAAGEDFVIVFKEHAIFRLDGPDFALSPVSYEIGCIAPRAIERVGDEIFFISQQGLSSINARSASITHHTKGKVSATLLQANTSISDSLKPPDVLGNAVTIALGIDNSRTSMAVDIENGIVALCYSDTGGYRDFTFMFYNVNSGKITFSDVAESSGIVTSVLLYTEPRDSTNARPLGTISIALKVGGGTTHYTGSINLTHNSETDIAYVRWPFKLFNPERRTSIRSIRPVFKDAKYASGSGSEPYTITSTIYTETESAVPWNQQVDTPGESIGNDHNIVFEGCPMGIMHSLGISIRNASASYSSQIFGFKGVEVEWEDGPPINA